LLQMVI